MAFNKLETELDREALKSQAAELHARGYNCAQSVLCALAPVLGIDEDAAFTLAEGFGAGMGGMTETCGAISGAVMALGHATSNGRTNPTSKGATYKLSHELCAGFTDKNGTTVCRELKGVGSPEGPRRSCPGCIDDAIDLTVDILNR